MVKWDVEEGEEGILRRKRVNRSICCRGRKVADLMIYLFLLQNKTKWALVYSPETVCVNLQLAVHTVQWNWICKLGRYLMGEGMLQMELHHLVFE